MLNCAKISLTAATRFNQFPYNTIKCWGKKASSPAMSLSTYTHPWLFWVFVTKDRIKFNMNYETRITSPNKNNNNNTTTWCWKQISAQESRPPSFTKRSTKFRPRDGLQISHKNSKYTKKIHRPVHKTYLRDFHCYNATNPRQIPNWQNIKRRLL